MHGDRPPCDVGHRCQVRSIDLADRYRGCDAVEDFEANRLVGRLGERLHLWKGDRTQVKGALGGLRETNDADAEAEVAGLAILLDEVYGSCDLAWQVLTILDARHGTRTAAAYATLLAGRGQAARSPALNPSRPA